MPVIESGQYSMRHSLGVEKQRVSPSFPNLHSVINCHQLGNKHPNTSRGLWGTFHIQTRTAPTGSK